jgi:membrane protein
MGEATAPEGRSRAARLVRWPLQVVRRLTGVLPAAVDGYFARRLPQHAAGIAYRVLFSLAPLAIVLVSIFGLVLQNDALRDDVVDWIVDLLPVSDEGKQNVEDAITNIASPASALGLVSLVVFAWASTGMMAALRNGLETAMQVPRSRPAARAKAVDFVLVAAAGALVLAAVGLSIAMQLVARVGHALTSALGLDGGVVDYATRVGTPLLLSTAVVILLYRFVPARRLRFRDAVAGAFVTALLLAAISAASAYIFDKATNLSVIYGSITAALVFLYSVYLYASAVLFGAVVAATWSEPPQGPGGPIVVQVKRAVVGLFVHRDPDEQQPPPQARPTPGAQPRDREWPATGSGTSPGRTR